MSEFCYTMKGTYMSALTIDKFMIPVLIDKLHRVYVTADNARDALKKAKDPEMADRFEVVETLDDSFRLGKTASFYAPAEVISQLEKNLDSIIVPSNMELIVPSLEVDPYN